MYKNIETSLDRAEELLAEMKGEYQRALHSKEVTGKAISLTHEVLEKLRGIMDRLARRYWEVHVRPHISEEDRAKATIYFPIVPDDQGLSSSLGRWRWKTVAGNHAEIADFLRSKQAYISQANNWIVKLNDIVQLGKHIDLLPQKRVEQKRVTVSRGGGSVSYGPGVSFGGGVSIMGAPVDPRTQRIVPTAGVTEKIEIWVSFAIEGQGVDALAFAADACAKVRALAEEMSSRFGI